MSTTSNFESLLVDVKAVLDSGSKEKLGTEQVMALAGMGGRMATHLKNDLDPRADTRKVRGEKVIYASELGSECIRKLYLRITDPNNPNVLPLEATARVKFIFGDLVEELALTLAEFAGHKVEDRQKEVVFDLKNGWTIRGRIDAVIDGVVVDVKSCSSRAFVKYVENGLTPETDTFGYLWQLGVYSAVLENPNAGFWFICKESGEQHVEGFSPKSVTEMQKVIRERGNQIVDMLESGTPPDRLADKPDGKSGNRKLCTTCSYCEFRTVCWPDARTFIYSHGPVFMTEVKKVPKVPEVRTDGTIDVPEKIDEAAATAAPEEGFLSEEEITDPPF